MPAPLFRTARVGLSLRRATGSSTHLAFIARPYRYLTSPALKKGRAHTIVSLLAQGQSDSHIAATCACPASTVASYRRHFDRGVTAGSGQGMLGKALAVDGLCFVLGACTSS